ncbi:hypothetical protein EXU57_08755 [Segetibacter sp. 3557_3]|nr:hypothetical protein EXU57_08755 [Segetibacter sp. 3557_3]
MPSRELFNSEEAYYATLYHELGQSTGCAPDTITRKSCKLALEVNYSKEELTAELTASFLCAIARIRQLTCKNLQPTFRDG